MKQIGFQWLDDCKSSRLQAESGQPSNDYLSFLRSACPLPASAHGLPPSSQPSSCGFTFLLSGLWGQLYHTKLQNFKSQLQCEDTHMIFKILLGHCFNRKSPISVICVVFVKTIEVNLCNNLTPFSFKILYC